MPNRTTIGWTHGPGFMGVSWNPVTGCDEISDGCDNCYAKEIAERFRGEKAFPYGFDLTLRPERLEQPLHWRRPFMSFVNSMSDLFHKDIPDDFIVRVFDTMERADWHIFQTLTKRSSLILDFLRQRYGKTPGPAHMWFGVSLENGRQLSRLRHLQQTPASLPFLSVEPLLGPIGTLDLSGIDWVIVGGESGSRARPMNLAWARTVRDQCVAAGVPFFMKQLGSKSGVAGVTGKGDDPTRWPADLRIQEFPENG